MTDSADNIQLSLLRINHEITQLYSFYLRTSRFEDSDCIIDKTIVKKMISSNLDSIKNIMSHTDSILQIACIKYNPMDEDDNDECDEYGCNSCGG